MLDLGNTVRRGGLISDLANSGRFTGFALESLRRLRAQIDESDGFALSNEFDRIERDRHWDAAVNYDRNTLVLQQ